MSFRGGQGRGGFRGGRGWRGGRGGRGGRFTPYEDQGPPEVVVELGSFLHPCEGDLVCKGSNEKVPYFNAPLYLENKSQIGKVDDIFGPMQNYYFSVKLLPDMKASSFKTDQKFYISPMKLLPLSRFLPMPKNQGKVEKMTPRGRGRGRGRGGFSGRGGFLSRGGFTARGGRGRGGRGSGREICEAFGRAGNSPSVALVIACNNMKKAGKRCRATGFRGRGRY